MFDVWMDCVLPKALSRKAPSEPILSDQQLAKAAMKKELAEAAARARGEDPAAEAAAEAEKRAREAKMLRKGGGKGSPAKARPVAAAGGKAAAKKK